MKAFRTIAVVALVYLGVSGIAGAIPLLLHPTGEPWAMPQTLLQHSPFHSYLIPGIILLAANGLLSVWVLGLTLRRYPGYGWWVAAQGCVLLGWLVVETLMLRVVVWPHYLYGVVALALIVTGTAVARAPSDSR
jgi:hypothetical protein